MCTHLIPALRQVRTASGSERLYDQVRSLPLAVLTLIVLLCFGCQQPKPGQAPAGRTFRDELNRPVTLNQTPQRIISLAPNVTEMLFALGLGDRIVGVTSYCDFPAEAKTKEKVGDTLQPNLERLITLRPDLVVVTTASQVEQLTRQLDQLGIPLYVTNPRSVRDVAVSLRHLGEVTGATTQAETLATSLEQRIEQVEHRVANQPKPRMLFVLQLAPLITTGRNTFLNDLITRAGGVSISSEESADYPQFSREAVVARAPEIIVAPALHGDGAIRKSDLQQAFPTTPAARNHRLVLINPDLTSRPGPRLVDGLEQLARALHPEKQ
jgi:iron complex transport system substrate-binding protein